MTGQPARALHRRTSRPRFLGWSGEAGLGPGSTKRLETAMTDAEDESSLMGGQEIAVRMGLSRQRVHQLAERPNFPVPEAWLWMGRVW